MSSNEISLEVKSRPLRLAFIVSTVAELMKAIELYTHLWGGVGNYIFRAPKTESDVGLLQQALLETNVDVILYFENTLDEKTRKMLSLSPTLELPINEGKLEEHINGPNLLRLREGTISHIALLLEELFPTRLSNSRFVLLEQVRARFEFFLSFFQGCPSETYSKYFDVHLDAKRLITPNSINDLIKVELLLSNYISPLRATLSECRSSTLYFSPPLNAQMLSIYLDDTKSLDLCTAYWNERSLSRCNTLLLPRRVFLNDLKASIATVLEVMPSIQGLYIYTITTEGKAQTIQQQVVDALGEFQKDIPVSVKYDTPKYSYLPVNYYYIDKPLVFSQNLSPDRSLRFRPTLPKGYTSSDSLFGYEAKTQFLSGSKLSFPQTLVSSVLLSNEIERIKRAKANSHDLGSLWLRNRLIRMGPGVVSGLVKAHTESRFYVHDAETVILEHIELEGILVKTNKHTRYVQGILRRLGGLDETLSSLTPEALTILEALTTKRASQNGFFINQIRSYLERRGIKKPREIIDRHLPELITLGLVRRGVAIKCPNCDLEDWYSLEIIGSLFRCNGCAESLSLQISGMSFAYSANELARRLIEDGGLAVFMTADVLQDINHESLIHFGGDLIRNGEKKVFAEVDIFWLSDNVLGVVECKSYKHINDEALVDFKESLQRLFGKVAKTIGVKIIILSVSTEQPSPRLNQLVAAFVNKGKRLDLGVHLIINRKLYIWGTEEVADLARIDTKRLLPEVKSKTKKAVVGNTPTHFSFGGLLDPLEDDIISNWLKYIQKKPAG